MREWCAIRKPHPPTQYSVSVVYFSLLFLPERLLTLRPECVLLLEGSSQVKLTLYDGVDVDKDADVIMSVRVCRCYSAAVTGLPHAAVLLHPQSVSRCRHHLCCESDGGFQSSAAHLESQEWDFNITSTLNSINKYSKHIIKCNDD